MKYMECDTCPFYNVWRDCCLEPVECPAEEDDEEDEG